MKATDRGVLIGVVVVSLVAAFWFLILSPKRSDAGALETKADDLRGEIAAQEALILASKAAQADYQRNYADVLVLGKAAPAGGDTPGLLEQIISLSDRANTSFNVLRLSADGEAPEATGAEATTTDQNEAPADPGAAEGTTPVTTVAPTEASVASLPLGATVGPAGLGVLPYSLEFSGDFFEVADLMKGIDSLVGRKGEEVDVNGRLVTVNDFAIKLEEVGSLPKVTLNVASYVLPKSQGLTAGATPAAPTPASAPVAP